MVRYFLPELHSSDISIITAVTNLRQEASFGNKVATHVWRLISLFTRSSALVVLKRRRCPAGKASTASPSGSAVSAHTASLGALFSYPSGPTFHKPWPSEIKNQ